jgi:crotonobetainyl-CoA:carnitine CoA-transferase CaiB-like acyl-CoA transferase
MPPLSGIKVLDFTHLLPGELCAATLSDMGAAVVRIESPTPGLAHKLPPIIEGESLFYWSMQRDKSRLKVDLKTEQGLALIKKLVPLCDVVIENFRTGVMERLGLGYEALSAINPDLIYLSITGYGQDSDRKEEPVHDLNLVAETGLLSLNCRENERPVLPSIPISDYMSGTLAALSIMGALYEKKTGGKGRALDISMSDATLSSMNVLGSMVLYTKKTPIEGGFAYPKELPNYNTYECKDGRYLAVASLERPFWKTFCATISRPDIEPMIEDPVLECELKELIAEVIKQKSLSEWTALFEGTNCCVSPVKTLNEAFETYPLKERGMIADLEHPVLGNVPQILMPVDKQLRKQQPPEKRDSRVSDLLSLLNNAGYSSDEIDKLTKSGIISLPGLPKDSELSAQAN